MLDSECDEWVWLICYCQVDTLVIFCFPFELEFELNQPWYHMKTKHHRSIRVTIPFIVQLPAINVSIVKILKTVSDVVYSGVDHQLVA